MVECHLAKVDVEGSNPFSRSTFRVVPDAITTLFTPFVADVHTPREDEELARLRRLSLIPGQLSSAVFSGAITGASSHAGGGSAARLRSR